MTWAGTITSVYNDQYDRRCFTAALRPVDDPGYPLSTAEFIVEEIPAHYRQRVEVGKSVSWSVGKGYDRVRVENDLDKQAASR